jgi:hypothetical protein
MNTALNLYTLPHASAADAYANELGREQLEAEAIQLCINERAVLIERTIRNGGIYRGHSILSVVINADDSTAVRMTKLLATMMDYSSNGADMSLVAALLVGSLEAEIKMQAAMIAAGEIDA